jgi:Immunity protein Imm1
MNRTENKPLNSATAGVWRLHDWERPYTKIDSDETLERLIRELPESGATPNRIADLESPSGHKLSIGIASRKDGNNPSLSQPLACVQITGASLDPPYLIPIGDASLNLENGGVAVFFYDGSWTEVLQRNCVPIDVAIRIALHFYRTEAVPDWIAWEEA